MGRYLEALESLNPAQRRAVETIDGPVLVIAGPGTGKTQLLTMRVAHILAVTDSLPQNILCLTFTDSAAQTMRERLTDLIGQAAYDVTISTYHAFGSDIIRRFPEYFSDQADLEPVDDLGIDQVFRQIVAGLPYSSPLKYSDAYIGDIKTLVSDAKRAVLSPKDLRQVANDNLAFITKANPVVQEALKGLTRIDKKSLPLFQELADRLREATNSLGRLCAGSLREAVKTASDSGRTATLTAWKNQWLAKDGEGQFVVDGARVNQKLLAAADIYEKYLLELNARGLFDYDDMILRAIQALEANNDLRFTLQEQYQYILLDEFQDTNGAQLRLVELLTNNPVNEGRPNVMAVGDDDQAIYAFQGADYSHMLKFKDLYKNVVAIPLTGNYRSHPDVLHLARGIAEQIEERLHHHFPEIEKTLDAVSQSLPKTAVVQRYEAKGEAAQLAWVAAKIGALIKEGMPPSEIAVLAPQHKYLEPLMPFLRQQAVPVRYEKRENVLDDPAINQLLKMSELVLAIARTDKATANALWPEVLSFDCWGLPTSRIWQLSWLSDSRKGDWTGQLLADKSLKPIALFFVRLSQLVPTEPLEVMLDYLIGSAPLALNESILGDYTSPYYHYYFTEPTNTPTKKSAKKSSLLEDSLPTDGGNGGADFWVLLNNLIVLRARLRDYRQDGDERLLLADLIEFANAHRAANLKIINTSPYATGEEAVEVMTAFKAKGREFTAVFVLGLSDEVWGDRARSQSTRLSLPPNLAHIRYGGATPNERLRLLYVAITRAKSQLYLTSYISAYTGRRLTRLKYLSETTSEDGQLISPLLPAKQQSVLNVESPNQPDLLATDLSAYWQKRHMAALEQANLKALLSERLKAFQLSPTHLTNFIDVVRGGPVDFFTRSLLRFPRLPSPQALYGNAIHETLEWIHNEAKRSGNIPSLAASQKTFNKHLAAKALSPHSNRLFEERGRAVLAAYLGQRAESISPDAILEYNFRDEGVFAGQAHLGGKIDKLLVNPRSKEITIIDFKTSKLHQRWSRDVSLHKYRWQLYLYQALVEGSRRFKGYRVTDAYLEFVEPDESGQIRELHLSLDKSEADRARRLAEAVWLHAVTLRLPDISGYSQDLSGIEQFETDLLTGDLLA